MDLQLQHSDIQTLKYPKIKLYFEGKKLTIALLLRAKFQVYCGHGVIVMTCAFEVAGIKEKLPHLTDRKTETRAAYLLVVTQRIVG